MSPVTTKFLRMYYFIKYKFSQRTQLDDEEDFTTKGLSQPATRKGALAFVLQSFVLPIICPTRYLSYWYQLENRKDQSLYVTFLFGNRFNDWDLFQ